MQNVDWALVIDVRIQSQMPARKDDPQTCSAVGEPYAYVLQFRWYRGSEAQALLLGLDAR